MPYGRPPCFFRLGTWEIDESRTAVFAVQQAAIDHDVEELADAGRRRCIRQLGADLLHRRPVTTMQDVHDLAFAPGEMGVDRFGHGVWRIISPHANIFALLLAVKAEMWLSLRKTDRTV